MLGLPMKRKLASRRQTCGQSSREAVCLKACGWRQGPGPATCTYRALPSQEAQISVARTICASRRTSGTFLNGLRSTKLQSKYMCLHQQSFVRQRRANRVHMSRHKAHLSGVTPSSVPRPVIR
jgi:hypothetical protein